MHTKRISFENATGHKLAALLDLPVDDAPAAYALFAHCFTCSKNYKAVAHVSRALAAEGVAVLRFDFTGLGESEFAGTSFSSNVDDLVAAGKFMERTMEAPKILIGHSLGGAAVIHAAGQLPSVRAVVTIGAPSTLDHLAGMLRSQTETFNVRDEAEVEIGGRSFRIRREFLDDLSAVSMHEAISGLDRALMIFHSPLDEVVGIDNATEILRAAKHPKSFISLDRADHLLSDPNDSRYVGGLIAGWARKYVGVPQEEDRKSARVGDNRVVVRTVAGGYRSQVLANGHTLVADEPLSAGGTDAGPSPYELLSSALGACTTMTLRMYADRKGWPLEAAEVSVRHAKVHCDDCARTGAANSRIDHITRDLALEGPLDEAQRTRLLEIADRCPVHRTLTGTIEITTILEGNSEFGIRN
ncbi:MAG: alpha/beta fold hydrolase [Verrucomicrobiales bacterium]